MLRATEVGKGATCVAIGPMPCVTQDIEVDIHPLPPRERRHNGDKQQQQLFGRKNEGEVSFGKRQGGGQGGSGTGEEDVDEDEDDLDGTFSIERYVNAANGASERSGANEGVVFAVLATAEDQALGDGGQDQDKGRNSVEVAAEETAAFTSVATAAELPAASPNRKIPSISRGVGFEAFTTSVVLGMDPAPRMSVACVDRLLDDLARSTFASVATATLGNIGASAINGFRKFSGAGVQSGWSEEGEVGEVIDDKWEALTRAEEKRTEATTAAAATAAGAHPPEPVLVPPGTLIHVDDDVHNTFVTAYDQTKRAAASTAAPRVLFSSRSSPPKLPSAQRGPGGAERQLDQKTRWDGGIGGSVVCFYSDASHYQRLYLSFALMAYHVPQRYLGALLAAVHQASITVGTTKRQQRRQDTESAKDESAGGVVAAADFNTRFEHVGR